MLLNETAAVVVLQLKDIEKKLNDYRKHQGKHLLHRDYNSADGESRLPLLTRNRRTSYVRTHTRTHVHTLSLFDLLDPPPPSLSHSLFVTFLVLSYTCCPTCTFLIDDVKICIIIHLSLALVSLVKCHFEYHVNRQTLCEICYIFIVCFDYT